MLGSLTNVLTADGTAITNASSGGTWEDSNGNENSWLIGPGSTGTQTNTVKDTLGRGFFTSQSTSDANGNPIKTTYTTYDSSGTARNYVVNWQVITVNTAFGNTSGGAYGAVTEISGLSWPVVSSIQLPNNQTYVFKYDNPGYGEITEIDLPTGGVLTYTYANLQDARKTRRYVASRTETVNGVSSTWNFAISVQGDPNFNQDVYTSTVTYPPVGSPSVTNQSVYVSSEAGVSDAKIYAGSATGTPLREYKINVATDSDPYADDACFNEAGNIVPPLVPQAVGQRVTSITTILENGLQSQKQFDYEIPPPYTYHPNHCTFKLAGSDSNVAKSYTTSRGNVTEIREYDWAQGAPGPLIRRTDNVYALNSSSNYLSRNIVDKITQQTVYNTSGTQSAQTQFEYDNYVGGQNALISTNSAQAPQHDYTNYSTSLVYRGNATRVKKWRNTDGALLTSTYTYDDLGNIRAIQDPRGNSTSYSYTDKWANASCPPASGNGQAYVTLVTNALSQNVQFTYFPCTGLTQDRQDQNDINASRSGTTYAYDLMGRVTQKTLADGGTTTTSYIDTVPVSTTTTVTATPSPNVSTVSDLDGLGRLIQTQLTTDPDGITYADTTYDAWGRKHTASNPYRSTSDPTYGIITYGFDALSRPTSVTDPDGLTVTMLYSGNIITVTDEAGKSRKSQSDGLGRLTNVWEDPAGLNYLTTYGYDVLGNLISVVQNGSRNRSFTYDSLSRLTSATNPESGMICYGTVSGGTCQNNGYDPNGNVVTKTDARNITTTATYDPLNRMTGKTYSDGTPQVVYGYDISNPFGEAATNPVGRLVQVWTGANPQFAAWTAFSYNSTGRLITQWNCLSFPWASTCPAIYTTSLAYDLAGHVTQMTYPSGRVVDSKFSGASRPLQVIFDNFNGTIVGYNYLSAATYAPQGTPAALSFGSGMTETSTYNKRLQPNGQQLASSILTALYRSYSFYDVNGKNNGNVISISDNLNPGRTQNFSYDSLNRIGTAKTTTTSGVDCWAQSFGYDPWGNLLTATPTQTGCPMTSLNVNMNINNRITNTGFSYNLSGNTLGDDLNTYVYDAESRIKSLNSGASTYSYYGDGQRAWKAVGSDTTGYIYLGNQPIAELKGNGDWSDYVYAGSRRIVRADTYQDRIHTYGVRCTSCGFTGAEFLLPSSGGLAGHVVQSGDKLYWRQYQGSGAHGGIAMWFSDGLYFTGAVDQDGQNASIDGTQLSWHYRRVDLTQFAGKTIDHWTFNTDTSTAAGSWDIYYEDVVFVSTDGTVLPLYTREKTVSLTVDAYPGMTGVGYEVNHWTLNGTAGAVSWWATTNYYHADHLGSSRTMTSVDGYPVLSSTFLPFGQEWNPQNTVNHYKFTGKERDTESGNDSFGARYYGSAMGRFMSPDPISISPAHLENPQRWNEYAYGLNNPLINVDLDGRFSSDGHTAITTAGLRRAGIDPSSSYGRAVLAANHAVDTGHYSGFLQAQLGPQHQEDHFLKAPEPDNQIGAYNHSMNRIHRLADAAFSEIKSHGLEAAANDVGAALHTIQDSYAHTQRDSSGAIVQVDCFTCTGVLGTGEHTHHDPDATNPNGSLTDPANTAADATASYLKLMNSAPQLTQDQFEQQYQQFAKKYFSQRLPSDH
jgi:RHS repeat-associated protein